MLATHARWLVLAALVALTMPGSRLSAANTPNQPAAKTESEALPRPSDVKSLAVHPERITLTGSDDAQQLVITAALNQGGVQDLSGDVKYEVANAQVARVTSAGRVLPLANGTTEITARFGDKVVKVPVTASKVGENLPINFANQVVPIFTKLGCNAGGCHGKASGQNGFRLSLLGFEPELDYMTLVKEGRGRRLFPASPDNSLLLQKAVGQIPHGGGKKMEKDSDEYRVLRRWIASGLPYGKADDPVVTKISVAPDKRILSRNNKQQISVLAHYSNGAVEDITRRAQYESNDTEIAGVDTAGLVRTFGSSGESAI